MVVVGAGKTPLQWACNINSAVNDWRGQLIATRIGKHACWYYPIYDPQWIIDKGGDYGKSEFEKVFENDIKELWKILPEEPPIIYDAPYDKGITCITGQGGLSDIAILEGLLHGLLSEPEIGLDIETNGLRPYGTESFIHMVAVGTFNNTVVFPVVHDEGWSANHQKRIWQILYEFIVQSGRKICHNLAFEMEWLAFHLDKRILRKTEWEDTLAMAHTLRETPGTNSLDDLTREYFGFYLKDQSRIDLKHNKITDYPLDEALRYNGMDTKWTHLLKGKLMPKLNKNPVYVEEYERKVRLAPTLVLTQLKGVPIDFDYVDMMDRKLAQEVKDIEGKLNRCKEIGFYRKRFGAFEPTKPEQVLKLMNDVYKLNIASTGEEVLSELDKIEVPAAHLVLEHRAVTKLQTTYIQPLVDRTLVGSDGCIHSVYSSMRAVSGRLAASEPNIQNFPKRKRRDVRGVIGSKDGQWMVAADYGQIEARVFGMASEDRALVDALWTGFDIHGHWADRYMSVFPQVEDRIIVDYKIDGDDKKKIRKCFRDELKSFWVFAKFFGASNNSCSKSMKIPIEIVDEMEREFWGDFPGVQKWQKKLLQGYEKNLYVETLSGRRRRGAMTKNEIFNHPIQGTAADIVTLGMDVLSEKAEHEDNWELQPILNVHDDLTFLVQDQNLDAFLPVIAKEMCAHRFDFINVPLIVEIQVGTRWDQLKEVGVYRSNEIFNLSPP